MTEVLNSTKMTYKTIVRDLLMNGKRDLPTWSKEEFIATCELDYGVTEKTAQKVYESYHEALRSGDTASR